MGLFSSSSSQSSSEASDNRSMASDRALAAGGNRGALSYYNPAAPVFNFGRKSFPWKFWLLASGALLVWMIPSGRNLIKTVFRGLK